MESLGVFAKSKGKKRCHHTLPSRCEPQAIQALVGSNFKRSAQQVSVDPAETNFNLPTVCTEAAGFQIKKGKIRVRDLFYDFRLLFQVKGKSV